jgi:hypothetical protein
MSVPAPVPVPVLVRVFCVSRPGPWWRDQCKGTQRSPCTRYRPAKIGSGRCLLRQRRARCRRTVRVASVEMALSLSLLDYLPYTTHETDDSGLGCRS